ncbi:four helix bundle protein [candidate division WOR-3 bacterium]|uniref:Four helix bundle protein n=1 Tax=candidate division WOR-3 bacterium TaxID=2052148 RepID=A0A937XFN5_UNCW3|nr:four helix bundle protein [candidate division WOR-3 bacterium]
MATTIRSYKDLVVWQQAAALVELTYTLARRLPASERFGPVSQMTRAAVSVQANIAEGHGCQHRRVFLNHLSISQGSLVELETYTILVVRLGFVRQEQVDEVQSKIGDVGRLLSALVRALRRPPRVPNPSP